MNGEQDSGKIPISDISKQVADLPQHAGYKKSNLANQELVRILVDAFVSENYPSGIIEEDIENFMAQPQMDSTRRFTPPGSNIVASNRDTWNLYGNLSPRYIFSETPKSTLDGAQVVLLLSAMRIAADVHISREAGGLDEFVNSVRDPEYSTINPEYTVLIRGGLIDYASRFMSATTWEKVLAVADDFANDKLSRDMQAKLVQYEDKFMNRPEAENQTQQRPVTAFLMAATVINGHNEVPELVKSLRSASTPAQQPPPSV